MVLFFAYIPFPSFAQVKLPSIFTDNMMLQQKASVKFWGWATPGVTVSIAASRNNKKLTTITNAAGKWKLNISTPAAGGPYNIL